MSRFNPGLSSPKTIDDALFRLAATKSTWNPNFRKWIPKFRETFGDVTRWVPIGATCTVVDDATNFAVAGADKRADGTWVQTTGNAMKITKTTTAAKDAKVACALTSAMDLTGHHALLRYYIHEGSGDTSYTSINAIFLFLYDAAGKYAYWVDPGISGDGVVHFFPGWRTFPMRMLDYTIQTGFDITTVSKLEFWIQTYVGQESKTPSITVDSLDFFPKITPPIPYIMTFDGNYINQKAALAYLAAKGIRANVFVTVDTIGAPGRMTISDLQQAESMGHIINFHERSTEPKGWLYLSQEEKQISLKDSLIWLSQNGFTQSAGFAPLGTQWWHDRDTINTLHPYLEYARIGGHVRHTVPWNTRLVGENFDSNTHTVAIEATRRQEAIDRGTFFATCIHTLRPETACPLADFKTIVDSALADTNIRFCTIEELIATNWYADPH